jgi:hypothetical protein
LKQEKELKSHTSSPVVVKMHRNIKSYKEVNKMKRTVVILSLIFALAIALSASIPTLAETTTTTISGTVQSAITVSVTTSPEDLSTIIPGGSDATTGTGVVTVICNDKDGWTLTASDARTAPSPVAVGHLDDGTAALFNQLKLNGTSLESAVPLANTTSKTPKTGTPTNVTFTQTPDWGDAAGDYSIVVTFTATYK